MTIPTGQVVWNAPLLPSGVANLGDCMVPNSDGTAFVLATDAAMGTRRVEGIAITAYSGITGQIGSCQIQMAGTVDAGLFPELGPGTESWVRKTALGRLERFTPTYGGASQLVGQVGTDGRVHLMPGWNESLAAGQPTPPTTLPGGTGNQVQFRSTDGLTFQGAANVSYNVGLVVNAAGFVSFGAAPAGAGFVRFPSAGGSVLTLLGIKNTSNADTPIIRTGTGDTVIFGNVGQDVSLVGSASGFVAFGATPSTSGFIRVAYAGAGTVNVLSVKNSTAADTPIIRTGPGDACTFGHASLDYNAAGAVGSMSFNSFSMLAGSVNALTATGSSVLLGCNASFGNQHTNAYIYPATRVSIGVGAGVTYMEAVGGLIEMWKPIAGSASGTKPLQIGTSTIAVVGNTTLTAAQYSQPSIIFTGTPGATTQTFPHAAAGTTDFWVITNGTNGTMTISGGTGATVTIASAGTSIIISDGTNMRRIS